MLRNDRIYIANCVSGVFNTGRQLFIGRSSPNPDSDTTDYFPDYIIVDLPSGHIEENMTSSGYFTNLGIFKALCPKRVPTSVVNLPTEKLYNVAVAWNASGKWSIQTTPDEIGFAEENALMDCNSKYGNCILSEGEPRITSSVFSFYAILRSIDDGSKIYLVVNPDRESAKIRGLNYCSAQTKGACEIAVLDCNDNPHG